MGSINKTSKGEYSIRFWYKTPNGLKQKRLTGFKTKQEAKLAEAKFLTEYRQQLLSKQSPEDKNITFETLHYRYINIYLKNNVKTSSVFSTITRAEKHILPYFANKNIFEITSEDINLWKKHLSEKTFRGNKYSYAYLSALYSTLRKILYYAVDNYGLPYNPAVKAKNFKKPETVINPFEKSFDGNYWDYPTFQEFYKRLEHIDINHPLHEGKLMTLIMYNTGMRPNEAAVLEWKDILWETSEIAIYKTASYKNKGGQLRITTPKSKSRVIIISKQCMDELAKWRKKNKGKYVFGGEKPIYEKTIGRNLDQLINFANQNYSEKIPRITPKGLRHSHASYLFANHVDIATIAQRLGNTIEVLQKTYIHFLQSQNVPLEQALNNMKL